MGSFCPQIIVTFRLSYRSRFSVFRCSHWSMWVVVSFFGSACCSGALVVSVGPAVRCLVGCVRGRVQAGSRRCSPSRSCRMSSADNRRSSRSRYLLCRWVWPLLGHWCWGGGVQFLFGQCPNIGEMNFNGASLTHLVILHNIFWPHCHPGF